MLRLLVVEPALNPREPSERSYTEFDTLKQIISSSTTDIRSGSIEGDTGDTPFDAALTKAIDKVIEKIDSKIAINASRYQKFIDGVARLHKSTLGSLLLRLQGITLQDIEPLVRQLVTSNLSAGMSQIDDVSKLLFKDFLNLLELSDNLMLTGDGYSSYWVFSRKIDEKENEGGVFITLARENRDREEAIQVDDNGNTDEESLPVQTGWKLHVGINDTTVANLAAGWKIVKDICIKHKVNQLKVVAPNYFLRLTTRDEHVEGFCEGVLAFEKPSQRNKQITIYCDDSPHISVRQWSILVQEITEALAEAGVEPAPFTHMAERRYPGSNYVSYRNELDDDGRYHDISSLSNYNLTKYADPFRRCSVELSHQQPEYQSPEIVERNKLRVEKKELLARIARLETQAADTGLTQPQPASVGTNRPSIQQTDNSGRHVEKSKKEKRSKKKDKAEAGKAESVAAGSGDKEKKKEKKQQPK